MSFTIFIRISKVRPKITNRCFDKPLSSDLIKRLYYKSLHETKHFHLYESCNNTYGYTTLSNFIQDSSYFSGRTYTFINPTKLSQPGTISIYTTYQSFYLCHNGVFKNIYMDFRVRSTDGKFFRSKKKIQRLSLEYNLKAISTFTL